MEPVTDSQKLTLTEIYMSRYNAQNDLLNTLTIYGKKY